MKKNLLLLLVIFTVLSLNCFAKTYKVGMIHWIAYSPLNVADVKGLWKEQGIEVEVINYDSNQALNEALKTKKIDIALDMIGSWVGMYMQGEPLKIIGETDWSNGGDKIIVKKDLKAISKGDTVGVYLNLPSVTFFLNKYLEKQNIKLSNLKIVEQEPELLAKEFIDNKYKIIINYDPQALRAEKEGNGKLVATSADYGGVIPEGFVCREDVLASIPKEDLKKFFKGWISAVSWSENPKNWDEYKKILNEKTFVGEKPYSDKDLKDMLASVRIHSKKDQAYRNRINSGLYTYLKELNSFLKTNNQLKKDFKAEDIFDNSAITEALK